MRKCCRARNPFTIFHCIKFPASLRARRPIEVRAPTGISRPAGDGGRGVMFLRRRKVLFFGPPYFSLGIGFVPAILLFASAVWASKPGPLRTRGLRVKERPAELASRSRCTISLAGGRSLK